MKIDSSYFGHIMVSGKDFEHDIVLFWDGEILERKSNHLFTINNFNDLIMKEPEVVVIGTGTGGGMKIDSEIHTKASIEGIELFVGKTPEAVEEFNKQMKNHKKVAAVIHVTC